MGQVRYLYPHMQVHCASPPPWPPTQCCILFKVDKEGYVLNGKIEVARLALFCVRLSDIDISEM